MTQEQAISPASPGTAGHAMPGIDESPSTPYGQDLSYQSPRYDMYYRADAERGERLAKALGWFSIGLGIAQLVAPDGLARLIGVRQHPRVIRALGAREIINGVGILRQRRRSGWMWTRVAGDAMDLALLGAASRSAYSGDRRNRLGLATAAVAGVAVLDFISSLDNTQRERAEEGKQPVTDVHVVKSITVNRPADECYRFWRDFESFPRFMRHLESVRVIGDNLMHWKAKGPLGTSFQWNAQLTADEPEQYLAWCSVEESEVDNAGSVRFERAPGGRGTIVRVDLRYSPPAGRAGVMIAKLFGEEPAQQIDDDLRRFKSLMETGEIPTTAGQPAGTRGVVARLLRKGEPG